MTVLCCVELALVFFSGCCSSKSRRKKKNVHPKPLQNEDTHSMVRRDGVLQKRFSTLDVCTQHVETLVGLSGSGPLLSFSIGWNCKSNQNSSLGLNSPLNHGQSRCPLFFHCWIHSNWIDVVRILCFVQLHRRTHC